MKIVIADDHAMLREGLRHCFAAEDGIEIVGEARDGFEVQALARDLAPDVVVMDVAMPGVNGIEAARNMLSELGDEAPAVVFLSMHGDREFVTEAFRAGASGYLIKTSAFDELKRALVAVGSGRKYISPAVSDIFVDQVVDGAEEPTGGPFSVLTSRERQTLQMLAEGLSVKEISYRFGVSHKTVHAHRASVMQKIGAKSVADLTKYAIRHGLTSVD